MIDSVIRPLAKKHDLSQDVVRSLWTETKAAVAKKGYKEGTAKFYREVFKLHEAKAAKLAAKQPELNTPAPAAPKEKKELNVKPQGDQ